MFFVKDTREVRKVLKMKVYNEVYRCLNCEEESLYRTTKDIYFCECCNSQYIGLTPTKVEKLTKEGVIVETEEESD